MEPRSNPCTRAREIETIDPHELNPSDDDIKIASLIARIEQQTRN